MSALQPIGARLRDVLESKADDLRVAGAVVAVGVGGEDVALAHGSANLNTGQPFTDDTGFLLGSVTKVLVTTMVMQLVERGAVDLDAPVSRYVPEFTLRDAEAAAEITVRMVLNHTNGMDADSLIPDGVRGRDAGKQYTAALAQRDVLFDPGTWVHYSNPGFVVASRIIEENTGLPFERAIAQELLGPCGMVDATAIQTQAFLRRTAIGASADAKTGELRSTPLFTLPESIAGAGGTMIVTAADMLAFGRMHLNRGIAPDGKRILSQESVAAMQTPTFDTGLPQAPPIGLGWWLVTIAGTTTPCHMGNSLGGESSFSILPDYDAVIISFVSGGVGGGGPLNDLLHSAALEELTGRAVTPPFEVEPTAPSDEVTGDYASFQARTHVDKDGDSLVVTTALEFYDEDHARVLGALNLPPTMTVTYTSVSPDLFAPAGVEHAALSGFSGRGGLLATVPAAPGRRTGLQQLFRYTPRISG